MSKLMKSLLCALILSVTTASDIARIGYVMRRQDIQSSLPQHYRYTLVQPWGLSVAPFQVADGTVGTSTSRPSIRELLQAELCCWGEIRLWVELDSPEWLKTKNESSNSCWPALSSRASRWRTSVLLMANPTAATSWYCSSSVSSSLPCSSTGEASSLASPLRACDRKFRRRPSSDHRVTDCLFLIWDLLFCSAVHAAGDRRVPANYKVGIG
jgi:hypothetical protein